jgi:hypothetical protein
MRVTSRFFVSMLVAGLAACGSSRSEVGSGSGPDGAGGQAACVGEACGRACQGEAACGAGFYCGPQGTCTRECVQGSATCGSGKVCTATGRCVPNQVIDIGGGAAGGSGLPLPGTGGAQGCIKEELTFERQTPTVVLLVDQSGSMDQTFAGGSTNNDALRRWNILRTALMDPQTGIVARMADSIRFGLTLYTGPFGVGNQRRTPSGEPCPRLTSVVPALGNHAAILESYKENDWDGETPTGESVQAVAAELEAFAEPGPKIIVLATDGEPDTCAVPNPQNGQQASIDAVQEAYGKGIQTFVISVGSDVGEQHLRNVANAGQGLPIDDPGTRFYLANSQSELESAFNSIVVGVRSCVLQLNGEVQAGFEAQGTVTLEGTNLAYMGADGWVLGPDRKSVVLQGASCQLIKEAPAPRLAVDFPCGGFVPVVR